MKPGHATQGTVSAAMATGMGSPISAAAALPMMRARTDRVVSHTSRFHR